MDECLDLATLCDDRGLDIPSLTLSGPAASRALSSAPATVISNMPSTNAPADTSTPSTIVSAQSTDSPAQSSNTLTQPTITISPAQSTNTTTSSARQSCLIPHLLHVQVSVVLLGGLVHLALWNAIICPSCSFFPLPVTITSAEGQLSSEQRIEIEIDIKRKRKRKRKTDIGLLTKQCGAVWFVLECSRRTLCLLTLILSRHS